MSSSRLAAACATLSIALAGAGLFGPAAGASSERAPGDRQHAPAAAKTDPDDMKDACEARGPDAEEARVSCELR